MEANLLAKSDAIPQCMHARGCWRSDLQEICPQGVAVIVATGRVRKLDEARQDAPLGPRRHDGHADLGTRTVLHRGFVRPGHRRDGSPIATPEQAARGGRERRPSSLVFFARASIGFPISEGRVPGAEVGLPPVHPLSMVHENQDHDSDDEDDAEDGAEDSSDDDGGLAL